MSRIQPSPVRGTRLEVCLVRFLAEHPCGEPIRVRGWAKRQADLRHEFRLIAALEDLCNHRRRQSFRPDGGSRADAS